jgi:thioredoxin
MAVKKQFGSFQEMIQNSEKPVLVDFYATWCGPCQMMSQVLQQVSVQMHDEIQIVKIDGDRYTQLASQHQVHAYPTIVLYKNNQIAFRFEGVVPAPQLMQQLRQVLQN